MSMNDHLRRRASNTAPVLAAVQSSAILAERRPCVTVIPVVSG